ncbi:hypothetical protein [Pseudonocardia lacus]|uniref:hypothetical protein n=1 Tax=Pseudonocardia lacus TaxID=2835865 RepID=UPI001BDD6FF1|nr:hypothetical protein [Pseudonocardia lacus]
MTQQPYGPPGQHPGPGGPRPQGDHGRGGQPYPGPGAQGSGGHPYPAPTPPGPGGYPYPAQTPPGPGGHPYPDQFGQPYPPPYGPPPRGGVPVWAWISGGIALAVGVVVLMVVLLDGGDRKPSTPTTGTVPGVSAVRPPPAEPGGGSSVVGTDALPAGFGEPVTTPSGLTIEVGVPELYTPGPGAAGGGSARAIRFQTTVTNGGDAPYELLGYIIGPGATHAGLPVAVITEPGQPSQLSLSEVIPPGASTTYQTRFAVDAQSGELRLVYSPDLGTGPDVVIAGWLAVY